MASKIQSYNFYVAIKPYKVEEGTGEEYNELSVNVNYDASRKHFYASLHAGWTTEWHGHGCIILGDRNPLTSPTWIVLKDSPKNSQKFINEAGGALKQAKAGIAWLFDERMFTQLQQFVKDVALYGYTAMLEERIRSYKNERTVTAQVNAGRNNSKNQTISEDKVMMPKNQNESANVQNVAQVSNKANENVEVAELSMDDIKPRVTKREVAQAMVQAAQGGKATTMPLGSHGTLVIAGVPKSTERTEKTEGTEKPAAGSVGSGLPAVTLVVYTTKHGDQAPRIEGFGGDADPRWKRHYDEKQRLKAEKEKADKKNDRLKARMKGKSKEEKEKMMKQWVSVGSDPFNASIRVDYATGDKTYTMMMGAKYMDVAQQLVDAYNSGDAAAIAAAEQAVVDVKNGIVAGLQAQREARKAKPATDATGTATPAMDAKEQAMFDLFKKFMAGDATAMQQVGAMVAKQAA